MSACLPPEHARLPYAPMTAYAVLTVESRAGRGGTRIDVLRSEGPMVLRPAHSKGPEPLVHRARDVARVALAAGAAGPLGGDNWRFDVHVGAGATLVLNSVSAMLVLPGARGHRSHLLIDVQVEEGATLVWLPELMIAAHGCEHYHEVRVRLAPGARLVMREELLLGRWREAPGNFRTTQRVTCGGRALYHQQLRFGPAAAGARGPAVVGANRAVGSIIVVDPAWTEQPPPAAIFHPTAMLTPLAGPGAAVSAVAPDSLLLRRLLHTGLRHLGAPWALDEEDIPIPAPATAAVPVVNTFG